jgi:hypothetical protein
VTARGVAPVPVVCPATATQACAGTITVETKPVRQAKHKKKRRLRLGSRRVRIKPGGVKVIQIRIPKRHRALLKRLRTVRASVTVSAYSQVSASRVQTRKSGLTLRTHRIVAR